MAANALVQARIDGAVKEEAAAVLASMGLTVSDAVRLLLTKVAKEHALPFDPLSPNGETVEAMKEARRGKLQSFEDVEHRAKVVTLDQIKEEGWTLDISRYVLPPIGEDIPTLPEAVVAFKHALAEARDAEDHLRTVLTEGGWLE